MVSPLGVAAGIPESATMCILLIVEAACCRQLLVQPHLSYKSKPSYWHNIYELWACYSIGPLALCMHYNGCLAAFREKQPGVQLSKQVPNCTIDCMIILLKRYKHPNGSWLKSPKEKDQLFRACIIRFMPSCHCTAKIQWPAWVNKAWQNLGGLHLYCYMHDMCSAGPLK